MKRQFCKWKDVGAVVPIRTSSRIWSSLNVAAGSKYLVALRLRMHSMTALAAVIPSLMVIPMGEGIGAARWLRPMGFMRCRGGLVFGRPSGPQDRTRPAKLEVPFGHAFDKCVAS